MDEAAAELWSISDRELQEIRRSLEELGRGRLDHEEGLEHETHEMSRKPRNRKGAKGFREFRAVSRVS